MVPGMTWKECKWNSTERNHNAQIEHRHLPTLNLGIVNKQFSLFLNHHQRPRRPPCHPPTSHYHAHPSPTTTTAMTTWQCHVSKRRSGHITQDGRCHVTVHKVATKQRMMMMSLFIVSGDVIMVRSPLLHPKTTC